MTEKRGLYFLGGTIVDSGVLSRAQKYSNLVRGYLGDDCIREKERHLTILPPFYTDYETASMINYSCMAVSLLSSHPFNSTLFSIKELEVMEFEGRGIVHFPVKVHENQSERNFISFVKRMREKANEEGISWRSPLPPDFTPHITVADIGDINKKEKINRIIRKSRGESLLIFRLVYPTLYAKYGSNWDTLHRDPTFKE